MIDLLIYLGDLGIHRLLVGGHNIKLKGQLVDGLIKGLIGLGLGHYEALHKTLQVRLGLRSWRRWVIGHFMLEPRWLHRILGMRVGLLMERIRVTLPTLIVGGRVRNILLWGVKAMKGVSMLNSRRANVALYKGMPLHTTGLTSSINSNWLGVRACPIFVPVHPPC